MALPTFLFIAAAFCLIAWIYSNYFSFMGQRPHDYDKLGTPFDIRNALNGPILCEGVIYGPLGRVNARFVAKMNANWIGAIGTMTEEFQYDTGETLSRVWHLEMKDNGAFAASAPDIIGTGQGQQMGSAVHLYYKLELPEDSGGHVLDVTDWMYLMENGTIINRSQMRKFGFKVGELVATMRKA